MSLLSILNIPVTVIIFYGIPYLAALLVIVFVHELGHFLVARWCGVAIETFSIGFGREIAGWYDRHGTRWKLSWLPLGGYVKFRGDANATSLGETSPPRGTERDPGDFHGKPVWQRAAVVAAGPIANFLLAIAIFAGALTLVGVPVIAPKVFETLPGSAAEKVGIKPGDIVTAIDGQHIVYFSDLQQAIINRAGEQVHIDIDRGGDHIALTVVPDIHWEPDGFGGKYSMGLLGIKPDPNSQVAYKRLGPIDALEKGTGRTWFIVSATFKYLGKMVTGQVSTDQLGGPIRSAKIAGDAASGGLFNFISIIGFLSVSIGLINLFPIPMLDGGHLVYYGIEALRGKPLGPNAQEWGFRIGFSMVVMLMVVGTWNDVVRLITMAFGG